MSETQTQFQCPVEECDYRGQSMHGLRSHVNASKDDKHPLWGEIKQEIAEPAEKPEPDSEETDVSESQQNDTETMPTTDEYQQQYQDDTDSDTDSDTSNSNSLSIPSLPMNPTTLLVLFVIAISLYLMYRTVGSSSASANGLDSDEIAETDTTPEDTSFEADGDELEPGLIGG